ncbi:MAG: hypothetical protein P4L85_05450 [Paludisphaera borealis]|uniref:hypothetical protein n=1 Tax=Paludisphaera borealis TaxID=1387353 RepID=UPI00284A21C8|nr:hypothetical protein [Paludisphaera borealis]MDR3618776.1 hypothetical protein [Paludisphaera borealis]
MSGLTSANLRKATALAVFAGLTLGSAAFSGCGSDSSGGAPAPVSQEVAKKSMEASGNYYKQQHAKK